MPSQENEAQVWATMERQWQAQRQQAAVPVPTTKGKGEGGISKIFPAAVEERGTKERVGMGEEADTDLKECLEGLPNMYGVCGEEEKGRTAAGAITPILEDKQCFFPIIPPNMADVCDCTH